MGRGGDRVEEVIAGPRKHTQRTLSISSVNSTAHINAKTAPEDVSGPAQVELPPIDESARIPERRITNVKPRRRLLTCFNPQGVCRLNRLLFRNWNTFYEINYFCSLHQL